MRLPLVGGAYAARSIIANSQRCINLFPESNREDSTTPLTHYQRPGLVPFANGPVAPVRGLYQASNGNGYAVIGQNVYSINPVTFVISLLGQLVEPRFTPVSFIDNGIDILLVDSSTIGYTIHLADNAFAQFVDPTGLFTGATRVDIIDGFTLWNILGTPSFGSTLDNVLTIDPTYSAAKNVYPDELISLIVNQHELFLLGRLKSEIWYNAGGENFPFALLPGAYIEHGLLAAYSLSAMDVGVYWLGQDLYGQGIVFRQRRYDTKRISNHALEEAIRQMAKTGPISDAIGYCYQQGGHSFYVLNFPTGNQTWVWDEAIGDPEKGWHQRCWTDGNGKLNRDRGNCHAMIGGRNIVGDWQNGTLYFLDLDEFADTVGGVRQALTCIRTFPHIGATPGPNGPIPIDGNRLKITQVQADIECGNAPLDAAGEPAKIGLRWSVDRGNTFGQTVLESNGAPGQFITNPQWRIIDSQSRDPVFELSYSIDGAAALNGLWIDVQGLPT